VIAVPATSGHLGPERIPMVVLGGWLGSGKTTLLNRLPRAAAPGGRIAVVVNDVGPCTSQVAPCRHRS